MSYQINYNGTKNHVTFQGALTRTAQLPNDLVFFAKQHVVRNIQSELFLGQPAAGEKFLGFGEVLLTWFPYSFTYLLHRKRVQTQKYSNISVPFDYLPNPVFRLNYLRDPVFHLNYLRSGKDPPHPPGGFGTKVLYHRKFSVCKPYGLVQQWYHIINRPTSHVSITGRCEPMALLLVLS